MMISNCCREYISVGFGGGARGSVGVLNGGLKGGFIGFLGAGSGPGEKGGWSCEFVKLWN